MAAFAFSFDSADPGAADFQFGSYRAASGYFYPLWSGFFSGNGSLDHDELYGNRILLHQYLFWLGSRDKDSLCTAWRLAGHGSRYCGEHSYCFFHKLDTSL